ncbi:MAG: hypothetical protein ACXW2U_08795 [Telluria sp.]
MSTTTATRRPARTTPPGTGLLHQALEDARDLASLRAFCARQHCAIADVSADGVRLDMLRVLDLMRTRGYVVSAPKRPQHQPKKGSTAWIVSVQTAGAQFDMGFYTPNTP